MLAIIALVAGLQLAAVYTPLNDLLDLEPLGGADLAVRVLAAAGVLAVLETVKTRKLATRSGGAA